ncbi:hypothetical protein [Natronospora cellulosivora (SeqCode)]
MEVWQGVLKMYDWYKNYRIELRVLKINNYTYDYTEKMLKKQIRILKNNGLDSYCPVYYNNLEKIRGFKADNEKLISEIKDKWKNK